jgi:hypothetical protein
MQDYRDTRSKYANYGDLYLSVEKELNADYDKIKPKGNMRINFREFRKIVNTYLDLVIKESIDSYNGKDFLKNFGKLQVIGHPHTKLLLNKRGNPVRTHNLDYVFYRMKWKTKHGNYKIVLDNYYKKKYLYNLNQLNKEYQVYESTS